MKICKSCGAELGSSFVLGNKCPNCKIKIVYESEPRTPLLKTIWSGVTMFIGIVFLGFIAWGIISMPVRIYRNIQFRKVLPIYYDIMADVEQDLSLENTEKSVVEFEAYVMNHLEEFEYLAKKGKALKDEWLLLESERDDGRIVTGKAGKFIVKNKDNFKNKKVKKLLKKIGFFE